MLLLMRHSTRCDKIALMQKDAVNLPGDKDALTELVYQQQQKIEQQSQFIETLLEQIRLARHQHFGTRSERFNIDQMALVFNEAEALVELAAKDPGSKALQRGDNDIEVPAHKRSRGGRRPLPGELPRVDVVHQLDESDCDCGSCCQPMVAVSEKVSEQLDIIPAQVQVIRHVRKTYACKTCDSRPKTANPATATHPKEYGKSWYVGPRGGE